MGLREETRVRCPGHLAWIRGHMCAINGMCDGLFRHECSGPIQAAHVRSGGDGGTGLKPGDDKTIPLCASAHSTQHLMGENEFESRFYIDMKKTAADLWARSPHRLKYEQKKRV